MAFTEATLYDALGQACAHSTGTFKYVKRKPAAGQPDAPGGAISTD
jgi:hypothetical protein